MSSPSLELKHQTVYRAGAGAGKTTTLVAEVIRIAKEFRREHGKYPRMVVTTFTRKATQELRERILKAALLAEDHDLTSYVVSKTDLQISTIHGVLYKLLARYGGRIGIDPGFSFVTDGQVFKKYKKLVRDAALADPKYEELISLFSLQALTQKLLKLDKLTQLSPEATPLTEEDMLSQMVALQMEVYTEVTSALRSARAVVSGESWNLYLDLVAEAAVRVKAGDVEAVTEIFKGSKRPSSKKAKEEMPEEAADSLAQAVERMKELAKLGVDKEFCKRAHHFFDLFHQLHAEVYEKVLNWKRRSGKIQINDLESLSLKILSDHADITYAFAESWDYWLIDEYQDTSPIQVKLIDYMKGERPTYYVGDPQQSIYFFRGARFEVFEQRQKQIVASGGTLKKLEKNYRSKPELLLFLNELTEKFGKGFSPMEPRGPITDASQVIAEIAVAEDEEDEKRFILTKIIELFAEGVPYDKMCILARKNDQLKSVSEFLNRFDIPTQVHASGQFVNRREILDLCALVRFLSNPHNDYALIELLRSPWFRVEDQVLSSLRLGYVKRSIPKTDGLKKSFWQYFEQVYNEKQVSDTARVARVNLAGLLKEAYNFGLPHAVEKAVVQSGMVHFSQLHDPSGRREANIWKFLSQLREESRQPGFHPYEFTETYGEAIDVDSGSADADATPAIEPNRVNLMTVHMSKGLQFGHVFVIELDKKPTASKRADVMYDEDTEKWLMSLPGENGDKPLYPLEAKAIAEKKKIQEFLESERLFYVAVTRAQEKLYLSWSLKRKSDGESDEDSVDTKNSNSSFGEGKEKDRSGSSEEDAKAVSWQSLLPRKIREVLQTENVGLIVGDAFTYKIGYGPFELPTHAKVDYAKNVVREKYVHIESAEVFQKFSVTNWLKKTSPGESNVVIREDANVSKEQNVPENGQKNHAKPAENFLDDKIISAQETAYEGTVIHKIFESLHYSQNESHGEKNINQIIKHSGIEGEKIKKALAFLKNSKAAPFLKLIQNGKVEWGFLFRDKDEQGKRITIEGQIDLWGILDGVCWVVDYKSGSPRYVEKAKQQLDLYVRALKLLGVKEPVRSVAVYPLHEKAFVFDY